jgi:hypothetical protein
MVYGLLFMVFCYQLCNGFSAVVLPTGGRFNAQSANQLNFELLGGC